MYLDFSNKKSNFSIIENFITGSNNYGYGINLTIAGSKLMVKHDVLSVKYNDETILVNESIVNKYRYLLQYMLNKLEYTKLSYVLCDGIPYRVYTTNNDALAINDMYLALMKG